MAIKDADGTLRCPPGLEAARARTQFKPGNRESVSGGRTNLGRERRGPDGLTDRQREFMREYLSNGRNGAEAYLRLNPKSSRNTAKREASRILRTEAAQKLISEVDEREARATERAMKKCEIDRERLIAELNRIAFSDLRNVASWSMEEGIKLKPSDEITPDAAASVVEVKATQFGPAIKLASKLDALDKLARLAGLYSEKKPDEEEEGGIVIKGGLPED